MRKDSIGLSNSEMQVFRRCKRRWYLSHYRRLHKRVDDAAGSAVSIGNLVHDSLRAYYDPTDPVDPIQYAETALGLAIAQAPSQETEFRKEYDLVSKMLGGYMEWLTDEGADADLRIVAAEEKVSVPLRSGSEQIVLPNGARLNLISKLDVLVERKSDDHRLMLEHKTTDQLDAPIAGMRINSQYLTEHLARFLAYIEQGAEAEDAYNECNGVLVNMLKKSKRTARAKPPFFARVEVTHNIHELRTHWKHVVAVAKDIAETEMALDAGADHQTECPPTPIVDRCKWECEFFNVCALADDGSDFEGVLNAVYEERDPLERYTEDEE